MAAPSQEIKPAEQRGGGKCDVKKSNTEMIPAEWSCHSAPLLDGEQDDLNWAEKELEGK